MTREKGILKSRGKQLAWQSDNLFLSLMVSVSACQFFSETDMASELN